MEKYHFSVWADFICIQSSFDKHTIPNEKELGKQGRQQIFFSFKTFRWRSGQRQWPEDVLRFILIQTNKLTQTPNPPPRPLTNSFLGTPQPSHPPSWSWTSSAWARKRLQCRGRHPALFQCQINNSSICPWWLTCGPNITHHDGKKDGKIFIGPP